MGRSRVFVMLLIGAVGCGGGGATIVDAGVDAAAGLPDASDAAALDAGLPDAAALDAALCAVGLDDLVAATLTVTTDDNTKVYLNGVLVDASVHTWSDPQQYLVMIYRHPARTNLLAIEGVNLFNQPGYDRGVLADLRFTIDGAPQAVVTGASFVATNTLATGWETPTFDDSAWPAAVDLGAHGIAPWFDVFASLAPATTASWIWTYDPAAVAVKPEVESTYARRRFAVVDPRCPPVDTL